MKRNNDDIPVVGISESTLLIMSVTVIVNSQVVATMGVEWRR